MTRNPRYTVDPAGVFAPADPRLLSAPRDLGSLLQRLAAAGLFALGVVGFLLKAGAL